MSQKVLREEENGALLNLKVSPNSEKFEIREVNPWRHHLKISVSSHAKKGEANKELLTELEKILNRKVKIDSGVKSREKKVLIENCSIREAKKKLGIENL